jgi:hypothetical protein
MSATKVLLVNDDEFVGMALAESLEQGGSTVTRATVSPHSHRVFRAVVCLPGSLAQGHGPRYRRRAPMTGLASPSRLLSAYLRSSSYPPSSVYGYSLARTLCRP